MIVFDGEMGFKHWFGKTKGDILLANDLTVAIYLCSLIQTAPNFTSVISAFYAIKYVRGI